MKIKIKNLHLRTIIGIHEWERKNKQDVVINITIWFDGKKAVQSDRVEETVDYKSITKKVIAAVEGSRFHLLEKLAHQILKILIQDRRVTAANVEVDKPHALRFAESVAVEVNWERPG